MSKEVWVSDEMDGFLLGRQPHWEVLSALGPSSGDWWEIHEVDPGKPGPRNRG